MDKYFLRAVTDLRGSARPGHQKASTELRYLAQLPLTNDTPAQQAKAQADTRFLDTFFGTPGLLS